MWAPMTGQRTNRQEAERAFPSDTASIREARRFASMSTRELVDGLDERSDLLGDVELAVSELVTNAVEYGLAEPVTIRVAVDAATLVVSISSARNAAGIADPTTWAGPLPAMRTGRGLAIVRAITDEVSVDADDSTVTVHCSFALPGAS
jgi:anti-sigma regulatory factor (Ser/Thr protein kinase)